jgi:hypothetical protein
MGQQLTFAANDNLIEDLDDVYYSDNEESKARPESEEGSFVAKTNNLNIN